MLYGDYRVVYDHAGAGRLTEVVMELSCVFSGSDVAAGRCWDTGQWLSKRVTLEHVLKPLSASDSAFEHRKLPELKKTAKFNTDNLRAVCEALLIELVRGRVG